VLADYGVTVTVIESLQRVLPNEYVDVSKEIARAYRNLGVTIRSGNCSVRAWSAPTSPSCCPSSPWPNAGI
jgi:pyruvate/2-oxoglutarate dehydrogenase complex dihydrolipoamide dehydrogenase (E3) component